MKNKLVKIIGIIVFSLLVLLVSLRISDSFNYFKIESSVNEPNMRLGSHIFTSNMVTPDYYDFVLFKSPEINFSSSYVMFRLIGKEGDTIEINEGVVYTNGKNMDIDINLAHSYKLASKDYNSIKKSGNVIESSPKRQISVDSIMVDIEDKFAKTDERIKRVIFDPQFTDEDISQEYGNNWNKDNFGPVVVPENKIFLMGDNRDVAYDSRFTGFVDKSEVIGTLIWY